jgi:hypothetical protein
MIDRRETHAIITQSSHPIPNPMAFWFLQKGCAAEQRKIATHIFLSELC